MRHLLSVVFLATILSFFALPISGAANGNGIFTSTDGSFSFVYPSGWDIDASNKDKTTLSNQPLNQVDFKNNLIVDIFSPKSFTQYEKEGFGNSPNTIAQSVLIAWRDAPPIRTNGVGVTTLTPIPTPPELATKATIVVSDPVINGRPAARGSYYDAKFGTEIVRLLFVVDVGHGYCVVVHATTFKDATTLSNYEPIVKAILQSMTFDVTKYVAPTPTPDPFNVNGDKSVKWETAQGTLTFTNKEGWYFVQTESGRFIQNTPERLDISQPKSGIVQVAVTLPYFVRQGYLWQQLVDKGWHNDPTGDEQIAAKIQCTSVTPEITASVIVSKYYPSAEKRNELQANGTNFDPPENIRLGDKKATILRISTTTRDVLLVAVDMSPGDVVTMGAVAPAGELGQYESTLLEIASTFHYTRSAQCKSS